MRHLDLATRAQAQAGDGRMGGAKTASEPDDRGSSIAAFVLGLCESLATSWLLVSRLERVGERLGLSEALLGHGGCPGRRRARGHGLGDCSCPPSTGRRRRSDDWLERLQPGGLLGLGAVVAGRIGLHRKVVVLGGTAAWRSPRSVSWRGGQSRRVPGLALVLLVLVPYIVLLGAHREIRAGSGCREVDGVDSQRPSSRRKSSSKRRSALGVAVPGCLVGRRSFGRCGRGQRGHGEGRVRAGRALRDPEIIVGGLSSPL